MCHTHTHTHSVNALQLQVVESMWSKSNDPRRRQFAALMAETVAPMHIHTHSFNDAPLTPKQAIRQLYETWSIYMYALLEYASLQAAANASSSSDAKVTTSPHILNGTTTDLSHRLRKAAHGFISNFSPLQQDHDMDMDKNDRLSNVNVNGATPLYEGQVYDPHTAAHVVHNLLKHPLSDTLGLAGLCIKNADGTFDRFVILDVIFEC